MADREGPVPPKPMVQERVDQTSPEQAPRSEPEQHPATPTLANAQDVVGDKEQEVNDDPDTETLGTSRSSVGLSVSLCLWHDTHCHVNGGRERWSVSRPLPDRR